MSEQGMKKVVFVIVEGPSDETALGLILEKIFNNEKVYVHVTFGDITTKRGTHSGNVIRKIEECVRQYRTQYRLQKKDFWGIIHIVDTDGAFAPDSCIVDDQTAEDPIYTETEIRTNSKNKIELRNRQKSENLGRLSIVKEIASIPYRIFYMSSNLDHVLYNSQMSTDTEKEASAHQFAKKYRTDIEGFLEFITNSSFSVQGTYKASWIFIKEGTNSLKRHTNLGLCLSSKQIKELS